MSVCAKCHRPAVKEVVLCSVCARCFHPSCARQYIFSSGALKCCVNAFSRSTERIKSNKILKDKFDAGRPPLDNDSIHGSALSATDMSISNSASPKSTGGEIFVPISVASTSAPNIDATSSANIESLLLNQIVSLKDEIATQMTSFMEMQKEQFSAFQKQQISAISALEKRVDDLSTIHQRLDEHDATLNNMSASLAANNARLTAIDAKISTKEFSLPPPPSTYIKESAELIISGIPSAVKLQPLEIASRTLCALNLDHLITDVLSVEYFPRPRNSLQSLPASISSPSSSSNANFFRIIVLFKTNFIRDFVISKRIAIKSLTANSVFGIQSTSNLFLRPVYPKSVYALLTKARAKSKELNYNQPRVIGLVVHMCRDRDSPPIPVHTEVELNQFSPAI